MSRRVAFWSLHLGTVATVVGLSAEHARAHDYALTGTSRWGWTIAYLVVLLVASYGAGFPDAPVARSRLASAMAAAGAAALTISLVQLFVGSALLPRFVVFGSALLLPAWWTTVAVVHARSTRNTEHDTVAFVGSDFEAEALRADLDRDTEKPARLAAVMSVPAARGRRSNREPLVDVVIESGANVLVISRSAQSEPDVIAQASTLHEAGVRVRTLTSFYSEWMGKLPVSELERLALMFDISELHTESYARVKRLLDVAAGVVLAFVCAVVLPVVVLGNLVGNRGPLFYRQPRVGRDGRVFQIVKFRTMRPTDDDGDDEGVWTATCDARVTPFGRLLRKSHLDELPQCVNILRGDLSLVGPRPEQPQYVEQLVDKLPFYELRHLVRPGLTGWAQVKFGYAASESDALDKLQYDFYYLSHQSLAHDVRIITRTLRSVLGRKGR